MGIKIGIGDSTNQEIIVQHRRQAIVDAGLAVLREHGYSGFSQTRVAARAGLRQSHLTYYHPTRLDLLAAVGRGAVDRQLAAVESRSSSPPLQRERFPFLRNGCR